MRRARLALLLPLLIGMPACGQPDLGGPAATSTPCVDPAPSLVPNTDASVQQTDNGKTFCLRTDQTLAAFLRGSGAPAAVFAPLRTSDPKLLESVTNTSMTLPAGITAGFFHATGPGTATLSSTAPDGQPWQVQVVIRPR